MKMAHSEGWVSDTGQGIAAERLSKVFEKGETDQQGKGGTGLGLAIVKQYVEAHDGYITVESQPGAGTTFRFTLSSVRQTDR
ncbi:MAG: HAMP domain-containing sensor histidine kinase [Pyrinomonadaceae bacterium]